MAMRFSGRSSWDTGEGALARAARAAGGRLVDLTVSNPTVCGFDYDAAATLEALGDARAMTYDPDPRGIRSARTAVAGYYAGHGAHVDPDGVVLTTSTSEAYSFLFRLLCDAGDSVLVAQPSYPLFDFIADLEHVELRPYPLFYDFGWWIDFAQLERGIGPQTRALLLVHPNNPTGHATDRAERQRLEEFCVRHGLALVVDEVFLDYSLGERLESFAAGPHPCLTFVVSGLSKIAALPQMKVGWVAAFGPAAEREEALRRLEVIADTFLSMNAPAQYALPRWLAGAERMQRQIVARVRENLALVAIAGEESVTVYPVEAGWGAVLRLRTGRDVERELAVALVEEAAVLVHPGSFYGLAGRRSVVVSLIGPSEAFREGMTRLRRWCESG